MKQRLKEEEEEKERTKDQEIMEQGFAIIISSIREFASGIESEINQYGWLEKRSVIKKLVKRIEINLDAALKITTQPKTRCRKPYAATQHLMLLMMGVCT